MAATRNELARQEAAKGAAGAVSGTKSLLAQWLYLHGRLLVTQGAPEQAVEHGWSHNILVLQIQTHAHERHGKAISCSTLPATVSRSPAHAKFPRVFCRPLSTSMSLYFKTRPQAAWAKFTAPSLGMGESSGPRFPSRH